MGARGEEPPGCPEQRLKPSTFQSSGGKAKYLAVGNPSEGFPAHRQLMQWITGNFFFHRLKHFSFGYDEYFAFRKKGTTWICWVK
jgi:hypothetical protein